MLVRNHIIRKMLVKLKWICLFFLFFFKVKDIYGGDCTSLGLPGDLIASSFGKAAQAAPESIQGVWNSRINFFESRFYFFLFSQFFNDRVWFLSFFFTWSRGRYSSQFAIRHIQRYRSDSVAIRHDAWIEESILIWFTYNLADLVSVAINQTIIIFVYVFIIFNRSRSGRV